MFIGRYLGPPNPYDMIVKAPVWGGVGYVFGKAIGVSPKLCAMIAATAKVADFAFLLIVSYVPSIREVEINKVYAHTNLAVNATTLVAMRYLNLIGTPGFVLFSLLSAVKFKEIYADNTNGMQYYAEALSN